MWIAGLAMLAFGVDNHDLALWGVLLLVVRLICVPLLETIPRPTYIDEHYGRFKGAGAAFLNQLQTKPLAWAPSVLNL